MADRFAILPAATTSNWSSTGTWSASSGGGTGASVPTSTDDVYVNADSVAGASAVLAVDAAANCLSKDWTGATNTPTLAFVASTLTIYGNVTIITNMVLSGNTNGAKAITLQGTNPQLLTTGNNSNLNYIVFNSNGSTITVSGDYNSSTTNALGLTRGELDITTATINGKVLLIAGADAKTLTMGASLHNTEGINYSGSNLTVTANTATINITGTGDCALGSANWNGASFNLNGTAHTVSGSPTGINVLNCKADQTQTITVTAGANITATTANLRGDATHAHTIKSGTAGTLAQIIATTVNDDYCTFTDMIIADIGGDVSVNCSGVGGGTFAGADNTFNNVQVAGSGNYALTKTGNNTFNRLTVDRSAANKAIVATGTTQTMADFVCATSGTNTLTITGGTWIKTGSGSILADYLVISGSTASPAKGWFAGLNSTDGGTNTGWNFSLPTKGLIVQIPSIREIRIVRGIL
jgi:hypothetical protein